MVLMERMYSANPHFVRCVKPNSKKEPGVVDSQLVLQQVRQNGVLYKHFCHVSLGRADPTKKAVEMADSSFAEQRVGMPFVHVKILGTWCFCDRLLGPGLAMLVLSNSSSLM